MASCNARLQQRLDARALRRNSQVSVLGSLGENVQFFAQAGRHILRGQRCCDARVVCANGSILGTHDVSKIRVFPRASVVHNGSADVVHFTDHSRRMRGLRRSLLHTSRTLFTSVLLPRQIQSPIHLRPQILLQLASVAACFGSGCIP